MNKFVSATIRINKFVSAIRINKFVSAIGINKFVSWINKFVSWYDYLIKFVLATCIKQQTFYLWIKIHAPDLSIWGALQGGQINLKFNGRITIGFQKVAMQFPHHKCIQSFSG